MTAVDVKSFLPASRFEPVFPESTNALIFVDAESMSQAGRASVEGVSFRAVCDTLASFDGLALVLLDAGKAERTLPQLSALWPEELAERVAGAVPELGEALTAANYGAWAEIRAFLLENNLMGAPMLFLDGRAELYPASTQKWLLTWPEWEGFSQQTLKELDDRLLALGLEKKAFPA